MWLIFITIGITSAESNQNNAYRESGFFRYKEHCGICHSLKPPDKAGPPLEQVLKIYSSNIPDSAAFVERIFRWVKHPKPGASLMIIEVMQHKLMPRLPYDDKTIRKIAEWMWRASGCKEIPDETIETDWGAC